MKRLISLTLVVVLMLVCVGLVACGGAALSSDDRDKFIGNWVGSYGCESVGVEAVPDTMVIARGSGDLDFVITLHADFLNPDTVDGKLTHVNVITIPVQSMGGVPGTGKITYSNNTLTLTQMAFGITCEGTDYMKSSGIPAESAFHPKSTGSALATTG